MSIASEITRLQGVKSDILQAISNKGVTVPAGSALADCPGLIGLIQTGGGGGDIAAIRCTKNLVQNRFEIPIITDTRATFEIGLNMSADWGNNSMGLFNGLGTTYYPAIGLVNYANRSTSFALRLENNASSSDVKTVLYPNNFNFYHVKIYSTSDNGFLRATDSDGNVKENSLGRLFDLYAIEKIRLFNGNSVGNDTMAGIMIYYFRVTDHGNIILDLVPAEQNGVPGFLDNVSGNFYGPAVNDGTFEAVKPRRPI